MSKYYSKKVMVDNLKFDSKKEANYYLELKLLLKSGGNTNENIWNIRFR